MQRESTEKEPREAREEKDRKEKKRAVVYGLELLGIKRS